MVRMADLIARVAQPGRVDWIGLRAARRAAVQETAEIEIDVAGIPGDHGREGKRAVTLVQMEHLAAIGSFLGNGPVPVAALRRNLGVSGINLASLRGRRVHVGTALLEITGPCAPCSRMEEVFGHGGYAAVRGHGGMTARVIRPGRVALGDPVLPEA